jgi:hypothetical protein
MDSLVEPPYNPDTCNSHDKNLLIQSLLSMGHARDWETARLEWSFYDAYLQPTYTNCLCGHGIKERCVLRNSHTEHRAIVGNCCVKEFMHEICNDFSTDAVFASIRRVKKSPGKTVHKHLVKLAKERKRITSRAESWYSRCRGKRTLTETEVAYRIILNARILDARLVHEAERFCLPVRGPWKLDDQLLRQAREQGRLTDWEVKFYEENYGKPRVSAKQAPIKRRIEELTLPAPWALDEETLQRALEQRLISSWEHAFYLSNLQRPFFTAKQAEIKWRIEDKVRVEAHEGGDA